MAPWANLYFGVLSLSLSPQLRGTAGGRGRHEVEWGEEVWREWLPLCLAHLLPWLPLGSHLAAVSLAYCCTSAHVEPAASPGQVRWGREGVRGAQLAGQVALSPSQFQALWASSQPHHSRWGICAHTCLHCPTQLLLSSGCMRKVWGLIWVGWR